MNALEFKAGMDRLYSVFGEMHYPGEIKKLIWDAVKPYSDDFLYLTISEMISVFPINKPPQIADFREAAAKEREKLHERQKAGFRQDADDFFHGSKYADDDRAFFMNSIKKRMLGQMSDDEWTAFMNILNQSKPIQVGCKNCGGKGVLVHDGYAYRCRCPEGDHRKERFPLYSAK